MRNNWFSKAQLYLKSYGLSNTLIAVANKVFLYLGLRKSKTIFFKCYVSSPNSLIPGIFNISVLNLDDIHDFNQMKFYEFINPELLLKTGQAKILLAKDDNRIVGYIIIDQSPVHQIHGLGTWRQDGHEAWLGPAYVIPKYRNRGLNGLLIKKSFEYCAANGITCLYNCINKRNISSIRSFMKNGFSPIGNIVIGYRYGSAFMKINEDTPISCISIKLRNNLKIL